MLPTMNIVFIQILATATINFSLSGVQLLIEGGFYYFGATLLGDTDTIDSIFGTNFQILKIDI